MCICITCMLKVKKIGADLEGRVSQVQSWWVEDSRMVMFDLAEEAKLKKMRAV